MGYFVGGYCATICNDRTRNRIRLKLDIKTLSEYENLNILQKINKEILLQILGDNYTDTVYTARENLDKYITNYLNDYATKMKRYGESKYKSSGFEKLVHLYDLKTEILYNEANLISYQINIEENIGRDSLHSILVKNLLFDLTDARLLTEDDIFGDNYSDQLNQRLVIQSLIDHKQDSIQQLQSLGYWGIADLEANSNFYVDRNTINYTFNPGEYADKDKGILKISVDFDSLQNILKKDSPISILINE